jgi:hypothetical protein
MVPISLVCLKTLTILTKGPNGEHIAVAGVVEDTSTIEASNMFLPSKHKQSIFKKKHKCSKKIRWAMDHP